MRPKLTIVVPVYNVEQYIYKCIESLCNQTLTNIEIIVVNDGSEDKSIEIVKNFKDSRIKILEKENGGLSSARNFGLSHATGEFITFVDSDDYIGISTAYEEMCKLAENNNSDIVCGNSIWYYSEEKQVSMEWEKKYFPSSNMKSEDYFLACLNSDRIYAPVCFNIYKYDVIKKNNIKFKEGVYHEDEDFTPKIILSSENISLYDAPFYVYIQRLGSITNSGLNKKRGNDIINICLGLESELIKIKNIDLQKKFQRYISSTVLGIIYKFRISTVDKEVKNFVWRNSCSYGLKLRSFMLYINENLYINIENIFRKLRS